MGVRRRGNSRGVSGKTKMSAGQSIRRHVMLTTALTVPTLFGYGTRQAYAACVSSGGSAVLCSGAITSQQTIPTNNADITMDTGATVNVTSGNGILIVGGGDVSFTNTAGGAVVGGVQGLQVGLNNSIPGSVTINSTQAISGGQRGVLSVNGSTGATTINAASVTGTRAEGIYSLHTNAGSAGDLSITTSGAVSGGTNGLKAMQAGQGALTINAASVTGTSGSGIGADISNAIATGDLSITTSGAVGGSTQGIDATQSGLGALTINAASATGTSGYGLRGTIDNTASTSDLRITATGAVHGGTDGIRAQHAGAGGTFVIIAPDAAITGGTTAIDTSIGTNDGTDTLTNEGTVTGIVKMGDGTNVINNELRGAIIGDLTTGTGDDTFTNEGTLTGDVDLGNGANVVNNKTGGTIAGDLITGTGNDTFANDGTFTGNVDLGEGNNVASNTSHNSFTGDFVTGSGNDTLTNTGAWTGTIDLGGGTNAFNNNAGGIFRSGATVVLGAGNVLTNAGTLSPGGSGTIATTAITGNFVQAAGGTLEIDVDPTIPSADLLTVSGTADLAGSVALVLTGDSKMEGEVTFLTAAGGVTDNGLAFAATPTVSYELLYPDSNSVALGYAASFARVDVGLTPNQSAVGTYLNQIMLAGSAELSALLTSLLGIADETEYQAALDLVQGDHQQNQTSMLFGTNRTFMNNLLSCPERLDGNEKDVADKTCLWSRVGGQVSDVSRSDTTAGGEEITWGFSGGYETAVPDLEQVRVGAMISVEDIQSNSNSGASSEGTRLRAGIKAEKGFGDLEASLGLFGGITSYDTTRPTFGGTGPAISDHDITFGSAVGRVSYSLDAGSMRFVPMLDLVLTHLNFGEVNETGAGAANLRIESTEEWIASATPAFGVVGTVAETEDVKVHASLKGGVSFYSQSELTFRSHFASAPVGVGGFTTMSGFDDVVGNVSGALQFELDEGMSFKAGYDGRFGGLATSHGGYLRAITPF